MNGVEKAGVVDGSGAGGFIGGSERMMWVFVKVRPEVEERGRDPRAKPKRRRQRVQIISNF